MKLVRYIKRGINLEDNIKEVELFFFRDAIELEKLQEEQDDQTDFTSLSNIKMESSEFGKIQSEQESWN
ncbi:unnamed protein product [Medioppia subpectinata]|uniref:Uncharacterized protein n=1 Tax=Medioppia subpectinata TaxID=1979941 RepID=A0A7R9KFL3_9ACAR|nr:unnamed protein product [Medioppia subpectinata]CAG2101675.1 unnamed protein product [Medioppia subpectinata]